MIKASPVLSQANPSTSVAIWTAEQAQVVRQGLGGRPMSLQPSKEASRARRAA